MRPKATDIQDDFPNFGLHLMFDAYEADPTKLADMKLIYNFLNNLPGLIGMNKLTSPQVYNVEPPTCTAGEEGVTGIVVILQSHISIHTFTAKRFFTADVYSCNDFQDQVSTVVSKLQSTFGGKHYELQVVTRGHHYKEQ
jgi:S-adenosylmethionine decarboxylase